VHHRKPGVSELDLMISLCPTCHAKVERTQMVLSEMNPLLRELWREKHPQGQEQLALEFEKRGPAVDVEMGGGAG
jgi:ferredoxin